MRCWQRSHGQLLLMNVKRRWFLRPLLSFTKYGLHHVPSRYLADGSMSFEDGILTFNCTLPLNLTSEASGNEVVVPILADGTITHFQWSVIITCQCVSFFLVIHVHEFFSFLFRNV